MESKQATSTREQVLRVLLQRETCSINELAEAVGINPISVRHHLNRLQAEGLVEGKEVRHGVGRPKLVYSLTTAGREQFPTRYIQLTLRLLEQLKETMPPPLVRSLFTQMAIDLASEYQDEIDGLPIEERLKLIQELLRGEGFHVELDVQENHYRLREVNCPYYHVGQSHPEVCSLDQTLISTLLDIPAQKIQCMLDGDSYCVYLIPKEKTPEMEANQ